MDDVRQRLRRLFHGALVLDMKALTARLPQRSRRSLFRDLVALEYLTSYTHTGRYYTLPKVPSFDEHGLWHFNKVGFSRAGTLIDTLVVQVEQSPGGRTHAELQALLHVRVHNTLLQLVRQERIGRQLLEGVHIYVSADEARAVEQLAGRRALARASVEAAERALTAEETVEVLLEALRGAPDDAETVRAIRQSIESLAQFVGAKQIVFGDVVPKGWVGRAIAF